MLHVTWVTSGGPVDIVKIRQPVAHPSNVSAKGHLQPRNTSSRQFRSSVLYKLQVIRRYHLMGETPNSQMSQNMRSDVLGLPTENENQPTLLSNLIKE